MELDERSKSMRRMIDGMRPLSTEEIAEIQRNVASGMQNSQDQMRSGHGMQNLFKPWACVLDSIQTEADLLAEGKAGIRKN